MEKLDRHYMERGSIIPMSGREMRAIVKEGLIGVFYSMRDMKFLTRKPRVKRQRAR